MGGYLAQAVLRNGDVTGVNIGSIVIAMVGAINVLFVWRARRKILSAIQRHGVEVNEDSNIRGPLMCQIGRAS